MRSSPSAATLPRMLPPRQRVLGLRPHRAFVSGITRDEQDQIIVRSTIGLAHALGLQTVAEGVEEQEQLDMLRGLGCELAQGFLWSPPLEPADFEQLAAWPDTVDVLLRFVGTPQSSSDAYRP